VWRPPDEKSLTMKEFRKVLGKRAGEAKTMAKQLLSGKVTWSNDLKAVFLPKRNPWVTAMPCKTRKGLDELRINVDSLRPERRRTALEIVKNRKPRGHQKLALPRKRYNISFEEKTVEILRKLAERTNRTRGELVALMVESIERSETPTIRMGGENRPLSAFLGERPRIRMTKSLARRTGAALRAKQS